jgi:hypothetical protein
MGERPTYLVWQLATSDPNEEQTMDAIYESK